MAIDSQFLSLCLSFVNPEPLPSLFNEAELHIAMIQDPPKASCGALHHNSAPVRSGGNSFWNILDVIAENGFHSLHRCVFFKKKKKASLIIYEYKSISSGRGRLISDQPSHTTISIEAE